MPFLTFCNLDAIEVPTNFNLIVFTYIHLINYLNVLLSEPRESQSKYLDSKLMVRLQICIN